MILSPSRTVSPEIATTFIITDLFFFKLENPHQAMRKIRNSIIDVIFREKKKKCHSLSTMCDLARNDFLSKLFIRGYFATTIRNMYSARSRAHVGEALLFVLDHETISMPNRIRLDRI